MPGADGPDHLPRLACGGASVLRLAREGEPVAVASGGTVDGVAAALSPDEEMCNFLSDTWRESLEAAMAEMGGSLGVERFLSPPQVVTEQA